MSEGFIHSWMQLGACHGSGYDTNYWYPFTHSGGPSPQERHRAEVALRICGTCPVRKMCLDYALNNWEFGKYGIWGGTSEFERRQMKRQSKKAS